MGGVTRRIMSRTERAVLNEGSTSSDRLHIHSLEVYAKLRMPSSETE